MAEKLPIKPSFYFSLESQQIKFQNLLFCFCFFLFVDTTVPKNLFIYENRNFFNSYNNWVNESLRIVLAVKFMFVQKIRVYFFKVLPDSLLDLHQVLQERIYWLS